MTLRVALAGLGTVGGEVARLIEMQGEHIAKHAGKPVKITAISARDKNKKRPFSSAGMAWIEHPVELAGHADVDCVVELMGGSEDPAKALALATLKAGKPYITANKALLAHHGVALATLAEEKKVPLYFEAAVAGGIPVIKTLREALAGNVIHEISGILNGTCNFILSTMQETGRGFADVLAEAQRLGYAEADPTFDVDGLDAGHKLVILAALAFGVPVDLAALKAEGIRKISAHDIHFAGELGYNIKLLGHARRSEKGFSMRISPYLVPRSKTLAHIGGPRNAVNIEADPVGGITLTGPGAGAGPTASAVLADIIDCAQGRYAAPFGVPIAHAAALPLLADEDTISSFYLRATVEDRTGVFAEIAEILRDSSISILSILQRSSDKPGTVPLVIITHETSEKAFKEALDKLAKLPSVKEPPTVIRIMHK